MMKYRFIVEGENKEDLERLSAKMNKSRLFQEAYSVMTMSCINEIRENKTTITIIQEAIAHLKGYAVIVEARTGFNAVAVNNCIKELQMIIEGKK